MTMDWRIKAGLQTAFSLLPWGEKLNYFAQRLNGSYSIAAQMAAFTDHRWRIQQLAKRFPIAGKTVMEIGTGWNGIGILTFALEGAAEIHSFDHVAHLRFDVMKQILALVAQRDPVPPAMLAARNLADLLKAANAHYHAPADAAETGLPAKSIDLIYSSSVLEHIPGADLERITAESARILRGRAHHHIALHDHLAGVDSRVTGVSFLAHPAWKWRLINNRISYHNRLRSKHFVELFHRHGGRIVHREERIPPGDLAAVKRMHVRIHADLPAEELAKSHLDVDVVFDLGPRRAMT